MLASRALSEPPVRIELTAFPLRVGCSTTELRWRAQRTAAQAMILLRRCGHCETEPSAGRGSLAAQPVLGNRPVDEEALDRVVHAAVALVVAGVPLPHAGDEHAVLELLGERL